MALKRLRGLHSINKDGGPGPPAAWPLCPEAAWLWEPEQFPQFPPLLSQKANSGQYHFKTPEVRNGWISQGWWQWGRGGWRREGQGRSSRLLLILTSTLPADINNTPPFIRKLSLGILTYWRPYNHYMARPGFESRSIWPQIWHCSSHYVKLPPKDGFSLP